MENTLHPYKQSGSHGNINIKVRWPIWTSAGCLSVCPGVCRTVYDGFSFTSSSLPFQMSMSTVLLLLVSSWQELNRLPIGILGMEGVSHGGATPGFVSDRSDGCYHGGCSFTPTSHWPHDLNQFMISDPVTVCGHSLSSGTLCQRLENMLQSTTWRSWRPLETKEKVKVVPDLFLDRVRDPTFLRGQLQGRPRSPLPVLPLCLRIPCAEYF